MCSRWRGSIPLNGSSSSRMRGSWTSAAASLARWRMPLEYVRIGRSAASVSSTVAIARSAARGRVGDALQVGVEERELATGQVAGHGLALGDEADLAVDLGASPNAAWPAMRTTPADGASRPAIRWRSVDLPAPLGPSRPVTPGPSANVMSLTATTLPYQRETCSSSMAGARVAGAGAAGGGAAGGMACGQGSPAVPACRSCVDRQVAAQDDREAGPTMPTTAATAIRPDRASRTTTTAGLSAIVPKIAALRPSTMSPGLSQHDEPGRCRRAASSDDDRPR